LPQQWKECITVPVYKKGDKTDCSNYRGISLLSTSYKSLFNLLLLKLSPHVYEIIRDNRPGFRHNRPTTDQIFCIPQILEKNWEYNETVYQLFTGLKKACDSSRGEVFYSNLIGFASPMKIVTLIKTCLSETYSKVRIGKYSSDTFPIQNYLK
jgi:hypothetical protein